MFASAFNGHLDIVKFLIEEIKVDPHEAAYEDKTPLLISAEKGHLEVVKYLIEEIKVDPNQVTND